MSKERMFLVEKFAHIERGLLSNLTKPDGVFKFSFRIWKQSDVLEPEENC